MQSIGRLEQQARGGTKVHQTHTNSIDQMLTAQQDANEQIV